MDFFVVEDWQQQYRGGGITWWSRSEIPSTSIRRNVPNNVFLDFPGRVLSNQGRGFSFGAIPGTDIFGDPNHQILIKIPTHIQAFPNPWQPPMPPCGQIRSQTSGFMWSLSQNPNFPVFQEVQVRPKSLRVFFSRTLRKSREKKRCLGRLPDAPAQLASLPAG